MLFLKTKTAGVATAVYELQRVVHGLIVIVDVHVCRGS